MARTMARTKKSVHRKQQDSAPQEGQAHLRVGGCGRDDNMVPEQVLGQKEDIHGKLMRPK